MSRSLVVALLAVLVTATGCGGGSAKDAEATAKPTPISRLNTAALDLTRTSFCTRLRERAVREAVAGAPGRGVAWRSGDKADVEPGLSDVVHEYGCRWTRAGTTARAWLFARPVSATQAADLIARSARRQGCRSVPGPDFGSPSQRQTCTLAEGGLRVRVAGLIGGVWLSCEISAPTGTDEAALSRRTDAWCVQVANAANRAK